MSCQEVSRHSEAAPVLPPQIPPSCGDLDVLPQDVIINILSMIPTPLVTSRVCRRMKVLAQDTVHQQLLDMGICSQVLTEKWGTSVNSICLSHLIRFGVNLPAIVAKDQKAGLRELKMLLDGNLELLSNPVQLQNFLAQRLLKNSQDVVKYFYGAKALLPEQEAVVHGSKGVFTVMVESVKSVVKKVVGQRSEEAIEDKNQLPKSTFPSRTKDVQKLVECIRDKKLERSFPVMRVRENPSQYASIPSIPMHMLCLPPHEVFAQLGENLTGMKVENGSVLPSSIGSLDTIHYLTLSRCSTKSLPEELGQLKLKGLRLEDCHALESLPESLLAMETLIRVAINNCSKLTPEDSVAATLAGNGVEVIWK